MNATELFTKNKISSVSDSNAIGAELSCFKADTASLYTINDLLLALTDTLKNKHRTNVQISPSEPELLGTPFSFNAENALELLRDICNFAGRRGDAVYIDVYEKDMHIFYDVYTLSSHDEQEENEQSTDEHELLKKAAECKALLSYDEDSTGKRTLSVCFGGLDIGTIGFKADAKRKRLPRW